MKKIIKSKKNTKMIDSTKKRIHIEMINIMTGARKKFKITIRKTKISCNILIKIIKIQCYTKMKDIIKNISKKKTSLKK